MPVRRAWVQPDGPESPGSPPQPNGNPTFPLGALLVLGLIAAQGLITTLRRTCGQVFVALTAVARVCHCLPRLVVILTLVIARPAGVDPIIDLLIVP